MTASDELRGRAFRADQPIVLDNNTMLLTLADALEVVERLSTALSDLLDVIADDELIPESVSYMKQARAALAPDAKGEKEKSFDNWNDVTPILSEEEPDADAG